MNAKLKMIPLCQLRPSKINVRKTYPLVDIEQLARTIAEKGVLKNLVVRPLGGQGEKRLYEIPAGGRRFAALKLLVKRGKINRAYPVPCLVRNDDDAEAIEVSLIENFTHAPLHPADQFEAFAELVGRGASADDVAARFGVTPTFVEQRLKLAGVSPRLVAEYRENAMSLEQFTAFTVVNDHQAQEDVWFNRPYVEMSPDMIRQFLTRSQVRGNDRRARFVGIAAYEQAGGIVTRDLFDTQDTGYFADSQLLDRLVADKLKAAAASVRDEGWSWVEVQADIDFPRIGRFERARMVKTKLGKSAEKRLVRLCSRYDELTARLEDAEDEDANEELERVSAQIAKLQQQKEKWPDKEKARSGAIVALGPDGAAAIFRGLVRTDQTESAAEPEAPAKPKRMDGYADSVLADLSAHRTMVLRELFAQRPEIALTALLHTMVGQLFSASRERTCLDIAASEMPLDRHSATVGASKAARAFQERHTAWATAVSGTDDLDRWLVELSVKDRARLLAHCVALTVNALHYPKRMRDVEADVQHWSTALGLEMAKWWRPTEANFLGRVPKRLILEAVREGVSEQAAQALSIVKKDRLVEKAETLLAETTWVPEPLRTSLVE